ncbi:MAG: hypothetical protein A2W52_03515 [Candidatus Taylorbacteria bacterium RIFCSPHIGHO2_02_49_25]|uniref:Uncharacterized protein n=1 Tax=Candidatus Taylorbacteria bacterium RIFCSPHIGHO2_02_49_25 TaxID=1802305 RepID=A0A1G2MDG4_9BACT|nr:MAG: hypothetical protein A2759_03020 [Candidatus Taylorbacteria bacterium RIFCSPHIGHO2_01_FULL_49_60]OHA21873.1 MAG: hypothetical protein A2W52_03515 [Candidatus Taylorbacteria bacterium RIFCSPHIGHO2_02_49_25]OHA36681.1 MAG: hypothetical protein A3B27_01255 [Candidatus Taylorbacteria bacterium RIFCSPLOWO2_01_FULL_50_130]OHA37551.1 MAG: hypothetical protein A2W65_02970 [Candidatus Taylorbacteria bacterium RIFCSPLOWO2_02_50_13]OHA42115.1 MAG: hypothetical protein A3H73_02530 [Candidatus Taylo
MKPALTVFMLEGGRSSEGTQTKASDGALGDAVRSRGERRFWGMENLRTIARYQCTQLINIVNSDMLCRRGILQFQWFCVELTTLLVPLAL